MRTEAQIARVDLEFRAIDNAYNKMHYLKFSPKTDAWKYYCQELGYKLADELSALEQLEEQR